MVYSIHAISRLCASRSGFPTNLESQGESGKVREFWVVRESQGKSQGILDGVREKRRRKEEKNAKINKRMQK